MPWAAVITDGAMVYDPDSTVHRLNDPASSRHRRQAGVRGQRRRRPATNPDLQAPPRPRRQSRPGGPAATLPSIRATSARTTSSRCGCRSLPMASRSSTTHPHGIYLVSLAGWPEWRCFHRPSDHPGGSLPYFGGARRRRASDGCGACGSGGRGRVVAWGPTAAARATVSLARWRCRSRATRSPAAAKSSSRCRRARQAGCSPCRCVTTSRSTTSSPRRSHPVWVRLGRPARCRQHCVDNQAHTRGRGRSVAPPRDGDCHRHVEPVSGAARMVRLTVTVAPTREARR